MLLASWQGWKVENLKLRLIFSKARLSFASLFICVQMWEVTCVCGMCGDVYVDVCLNTYGHAHVCVCLWRPEVDVRSFSLSLFHLIHQDRVSVKLRARWHWQVLLASLLWGFFVSASRITSCHVYLACTWLLGFQLPSFQLCGEPFLRLFHLSFWDRVSYWIWSTSFRLDGLATDLWGWGHRLRSSCLQSRPSHPPSHLPSSEIFLPKEKSLC